MLDIDKLCDILLDINDGLTKLSSSVALQNLQIAKLAAKLNRFQDALEKPHKQDKEKGYE